MRRVIARQPDIIIIEAQADVVVAANIVEPGRPF